MKSIILALATATALAGVAHAQQWGAPAYPDNWTGGPPLPPVGQSTYVQPQGYVVQYARPTARVYSNQGYNYGSAAVDPYYSPGQGPAAGQVTGPASARCIVAKLNGTQWPAGCASVQISQADYPGLREKFRHYQSGSGYVLNLPMDADFR